MLIGLRVICGILLCFLFLDAEARWASIEDAPLEIAFYNQDIKVKSDGKADYTVETRQKILNEAGRSSAAHYLLYYTDDSSKIEILEAKTIYKGKEYKVPAELIEDRPLASAPHGFDQRRQILISFPKVEVGAEVYLKYIERTLSSQIDDVYNYRLYYGERGYWRSSVININSELPLKYEVNDNNQYLKVEGDNHNIKITLNKPICTEIANGSEVGIIDDKNLTWFTVSTVATWKEFGSLLAKNYNETAQQKLPKSYDQIVKAAREKTNEIEQINTVTSMLNEQVQYMGDWRSVSGKFFPRPLEIVAQSQIGDCKDFSTGTVAMLRQLGYEANVALVMRGVRNRSVYAGLPGFFAFNHAMVKAVSKKDGKVYWIDPTNYISMAQGIFEDIAGKKTLVLDTKNPSYESIPEIDPSHSVITINKTITVTEDTVNNKGNLLLQGEKAAMLAGANLYISELSIKDMVFYLLSGSHLDDAHKKSLTLPDLSSRIVHDLDFGFEYTQDNQLMITNMGPGIDFSSAWSENLVNGTQGQVSDLMIGSARTIIEKTLIKGVKVPNIENINYHKDAPWIAVDRKCRYLGNDTEIVDTAIIKQPYIPSADINTDQYKELRRDLASRFQTSALILSKQ